MGNKTGRLRAAFTLIEILTVIAIIGILATILLPSIGSAISKAKRMKDANNLRQIVMGYLTYINGNSAGRELAQCKNLYDFANILAKHGCLATAEVYSSDSDPLVLASRLSAPKSIGRLNNGKWHPNGEFLKFPLSIVAVVNVSANAPASTTPIAYSRGLNAKTGTWDRNSTYSGEGGFIAFLDGHVQFFNNITEPENQLVHFYTGERTSNIVEAVNSGAKAVSHIGIEWEVK
jgi:prepilin-type N-terminal cleavage/methylation domain-containing protein